MGNACSCCCPRRGRRGTPAVLEREGGRNPVPAPPSQTTKEPDSASPPLRKLRTREMVESLGLQGRWTEVDVEEPGGEKAVWLNREPIGGLRMTLRTKKGARPKEGVPPQPTEKATYSHSPPYRSVSPYNRQCSEALRRRLRRTKTTDLLRLKVADRDDYFADIHDDGIRFPAPEPTLV